jgi:hypothetical protein
MALCVHGISDVLDFHTAKPDDTYEPGRETTRTTDLARRHPNGSNDERNQTGGEESSGE